MTKTIEIVFNIEENVIQLQADKDLSENKYNEILDYVQTKQYNNLQEIFDHILEILDDNKLRVIKGRKK